jgi:hypothetical protein
MHETVEIELHIETENGRSVWTMQFADLRIAGALQRELKPLGVTVRFREPARVGEEP